MSWARGIGGCGRGARHGCPCTDGAPTSTTSAHNEEGRWRQAAIPVKSSPGYGVVPHACHNGVARGVLDGISRTFHMPADQPFCLFVPHRPLLRIAF